MKKHIRYKPSKASAAMSLVVGVLFIIIGVTMVLPATFGSGFLPIGLFGLVWTGMAVVITITNIRYLFGKGTDPTFYGGFEVTDEKPEGNHAPTSLPAEAHDHITSTALSPKARLEQLETLKEAGLLTRAEYEEKRKEILREL